MTEPRLIQGSWGRLDVTRQGSGVRIDHADPEVRITQDVMAELMTGHHWAEVTPTYEPDGALLLIINGVNRSARYRMRWCEQYGLWHGRQA